MIDRALGLRCSLRLCASGGLAPMMLCCVVGSMPALSHAHVTRRQHRRRSFTLMMDDGAGFPPPITHGAARIALANTRMLLASANPLSRLKSPRTATCLRLAAASAPRKCKTTATRLRQSSRASPSHPPKELFLRQRGVHPCLVTELESQFAESEKMEVIIGANLKSLNFTT